MTASAFRPGSYQRIRHATASSPSGTQERASRPYAYLATSAGSGLGPHPASRLRTSSATSDGTAAVRPTYGVEFTCRARVPRLDCGTVSRSGGRSSQPRCSSRARSATGRAFRPPRLSRTSKSTASAWWAWGRSWRRGALNCQTLTSRFRFATAGRQVRARESPPEAGHAATGTRVGLRPRSHLPARQHVRP